MVLRRRRLGLRLGGPAELVNDSPEATHSSATPSPARGPAQPPSIVAWVPFNEKWGQFARAHRGHRARARPSRVITTSGWQHESWATMIDVHRYQGPAAHAPENLRGRLWASSVGWGTGCRPTWPAPLVAKAGCSAAKRCIALRLLRNRLYRDATSCRAGMSTQPLTWRWSSTAFMTRPRVMKFDTARTAAVNAASHRTSCRDADFTTPCGSIHQHPPRTPLHGRRSGPPREPAVPAPVTVRQNTTVRRAQLQNGRHAAPEARMVYTKVRGLAPASAPRAHSPRAALRVLQVHDPRARLPHALPVRWRSRPRGAPTTSGRADGRRLHGLAVAVGPHRAVRPRFTATSAARTVVTSHRGSRRRRGSLGRRAQRVRSLVQSPKSTDTIREIALQAGRPDTARIPGVRPAHVSVV